MIQSTPFNFMQTIKLFALIATVLGLASCGGAPIKPESTNQEAASPPVAKTKPVNISEAPLQSLSIDDLKQLRMQAAAQQDWSNYFVYSSQLWALLNNTPNLQAKLEDQAWSILNSLSSEQINVLENTQQADIQAWLSLQKTIQSQNQKFNLALLNLQSFESDAIFHKHLLPRLLNERHAEFGGEQIAVLLPFTGKYNVVSKQIRDGIIKAFFHSNQTANLRFYDSSDLANLQNTYSQAKLDGADRIIGPLRREALQELAGYQDSQMLALNQIDDASFLQFSFKSANPSAQMLDKLSQANFQRIGILANDNKKTLAKANQLQFSWLQADLNAEINIYPDTNPRLRDALGSLIHENRSKERKNNLRWMLGKELNFFPRLRQDLDAIVIFDDAHRMAVFRPQFDFFDIDMPILGSTELTPKNFQQSAINKDLKEVRFLTHPATLDPADLNSKFEAFGWDSFLISQHMTELREGACLSSGKTGILSLENNEIKQRYIWAEYDRKGQLTDASELPAKESKMSPENALESAVDNTAEQNINTNAIPATQAIPAIPNSEFLAP